MGSPWCSAGISSSSGACHRIANELTSSGAVAAQDRYAVSASRASVPAWTTNAKNTSGPTGTAWYSSEVTTPKLPPAPLSAQSRSGCSVALAVTSRPSAVTTSAERSASQLSPCLRRIQPKPAAEGEPGDAGLGHHAHRHRQPEHLGLAVQVADRHAALRPDPPRARVDPHAAHRRQVDDQAGVAHGVARHVVPAAAHGDRQTVLAPEGHGGSDVGDPDALGDEPRALVHHAVPHRAGLVVVGIGGPDQASPQLAGQLGSRPIQVRMARGFAHRAPPESGNRRWAGTLGRRLDDAPDAAPGWTDARGGHGSRLHHSFGLWPALVDDTTDVLEVDAGSYLQLRARAWPFGEAEVQIHLSSEGPAQTRMRLCEKAVRGPGRLIPAVVQAPLVDWRNREALRRLAMLAEGRAARPASQRPATTPHASNTRSSS